MFSSRHTSAGPLICVLTAAAMTFFLALFLMAEEQATILLYLGAGLVMLLGLRACGLLDVLLLAARNNETLWTRLMLCMSLALILLFHDDHYSLFLLGTIMTYSVAVLGLNVQLGYAGVINFSAASFFGVGGYTAALLMSNAGVHPLLALLLGGLASALTGCILLLPVLRTSGHYAALVTMAFALLFKVFLEVCPWFGGPQGIPVEGMNILGVSFMNDLRIGGLDFSFYAKYDLFALLLLCLTFGFIRRMERSWFGLSMDAVRGDEVASACFGVSIARWKITAFTMGNFITGVAGAFYAMMLAYISPANFSFADSLLFLSILLLGGIGNSWGVLVATTFVVALPEKFQVIQEYRYLIYSAIVLFMIIFRPAGLLPRRVRSYTGGMA